MTRTRQPVIGIITYGRRDVVVDNILYDQHYAVPADYVDAVRRAGGLPVLLPPGEKRVEDWMSAVDGFILTGGTDIDPIHYAGNSDHPNLLRFSPERDQCELALIKALIEDGKKPALFICRGMQLLNVALGGTLHEHIPDIREDDIHRGLEGGWTVQPVDVDTESNLYKIMKADFVETFSGHHQAVHVVPKSLAASATAPDGIIEALEDKAHPFFIAVQWHPEVSAETDESQQMLFDGLVSAALLNANQE